MVIGGIIMWSGSIATIPTGYVLCDGTNGTPDLRNKFILGSRIDNGGVAKSDLIGALAQTGGGTQHNHTGTTDGHDHNPGGNVTVADGIDQDVMTNTPTASNTDTFTSANTEEIPTFYSLAYIMKT